jgi:hypothetical protein
MKKILFALGAIFTGAFTSCMDLLDTAPYNQVATSTMWTTEALTDQGVAGIYATLRNWGPYNGGFTGTFGFESWGISGQHQYGEGFLTGATSSYYFFRDTWKNLYEGIHRANAAIANIPGAPVAEEKKARLIAEAKFLRAFFYYRLNELYRGVPVYTEPVPIEECTLTQSTEAEVWAQVIADLTGCINESGFPDNDFKEGRAAKGAAYALRGKAYMQQKDWSKAAADFAKVGDCGYALFQGGYKELFTEANERCPEMIFSVQNTGDKGYGSYSQKYCGTRSAYSVTGTNSWGDYQVAPDVVDLYENADGAPFNWDAVIPGYTAMEVKDREVYFLRDTLDADGNAIREDISRLVQNRLTALGAAAAHYLPYGNEARIRRAYDNRDPRLEMNVITPYGKFTGYNGVAPFSEMDLYLRWPVFGNNSQPSASKTNDLAVNASQYLYYFHRKFVYEGIGLEDRENCPTDEPLIRYADVLLMWAEALVELNQLQEAAAKVNQVRNRAGMPDVAYAGQDGLREKIRNERRVEFVNEGINLFDEMRWRTLKDTKFRGGANGGSRTVWGATGNAGNYRWPDGNDLYVWPVPKDEIEKNPNLKPTPGWIY